MATRTLVKTVQKPIGKNLIINGGFDFWQRATSFSNNGYGGLDRWRHYVGISTVTTSRQAFLLGQTEVEGHPKYFSSSVVAGSGVANSSVILGQKIESVESLSGKTVTLSFYAKADAVKNISIEGVQNFGTGGSPDLDVQGIGVKKISISTTWQKYTHTFTFPSVAGKSLGTNGNDSSAIYLWLDAGSDWDSRTDSLGQQSGTFDIAQVKLEEGSQATEFSRAGETLAEELRLCQRYYETRFVIWQNSANSWRTEVVDFVVEKRGVPTVNSYSQDGISGKYSYQTGYQSSTTHNATSGLQIFGEATKNFSIGVGSGASGTFYGFNCTWTAEAEL